MALLACALGASAQAVPDTVRVRYIAVPDTLVPLIQDVLRGKSDIVRRPFNSDFFSNNQSIGLRMGYTESKGTLASLVVDFDDDMNFDIKDAMYRNSSYTAAVMYRSYIGLSRRGRFGVFNEVDLSFSSGDSDFNRLIGGEPQRTHTTYMESRLSFSPGVCCLIMKNVSFNVSFGVVGFYLRNEKQSVNGEPTGNRFSSGANFRFNIFNINFGLGVHI